jgi:hypothetical protein
MISISQIRDYLSAHITDPVQKYIFAKEISRNPLSSLEYTEIYNEMTRSKWYRELADDQKEDGSWGSAFHGGNVKDQKRYKFTCTEAGIRRAREMNLPKDDSVIARCIHLLEKYINGESRAPYTIEDWHSRERDESEEAAAIRTLSIRLPKDDPEIVKCLEILDEYIRRVVPVPVKRKSIDKFTGWGYASNLNILDPNNPFVKPMQKIMVEIFKLYFKDGIYDEESHYIAENDGRMVWQHPRNAFTLMLLRGADCLEDSLQRHILNYAWGNVAAKHMNIQRNNRREKIGNATEHIWYMSDLPVFKRVLEEKDFTAWLSCLELFSGFSLFGEFMKSDAYPHLLCEAERLLNDDIILPNPRSGHVDTCGHETNGRYAENWRDKSKRKTDMLLRIARILVKC